MTVKPETRLWKNLKKCLNDGNYLASRLESYVTPGFPDCLVYHRRTGFFTLELKVVNRNNKVIISPFQNAWNSIHGLHGAPVYILVGGLKDNNVKLFHGSRTEELGQCTADQVPGLYEGRLEDLDLCQAVSNSQTP